MIARRPIFNHAAISTIVAADNLHMGKRVQKFKTALKMGSPDCAYTVFTRLFLGAEIAETLVEAGNLTIGINDPMLASPGRVRFGIDVEFQNIAFLAPC